MRKKPTHHNTYKKTLKSLVSKYKNGKKKTQYENYTGIIREIVKNKFVRKSHKIQIPKKIRNVYI